MIEKNVYEESGVVMLYTDLYKDKHKSKVNYGRGATFLLPQISLLIEHLNPKSILDYGCGKGDLVRTLSECYPNLEVTGYDPAVLEFSRFPEQTFDFIICTDVLEHIPEGELVDTIEKMSRLSQNVFFHLHHAKAVEILANGENAHCTVKPPEWYHNLFKRYFKNVQSLPGASYVNTACLTFEVPVEITAAYEKGIIEFMNHQEKQMQTRLKQALSLLECDFTQTMPSNTIFYGYSKICRIVLSKLSDKTNLLGIMDKNASMYSKGEYADGLIDLFSFDDAMVDDNSIMVIFPTWDFDDIVSKLKDKFPLLKEENIYRAEDFFMKL